MSELKLETGQFFVVSAHREENIDSEVNFNNLLQFLNAIAKKYKQPIIVSTHPRTRNKLESTGHVKIDPLVQFLKPLGFFEYIKLQLSAKCVISDSGTISEESSILNFPAVMIRQSHERPEGMDEGTLIMSGLNPEMVLKSVNIVTSDFSASTRVTKIVPDYDVDNVSLKVVRIIMSYLNYVNRTVWYK